MKHIKYLNTIWAGAYVDMINEAFSSYEKELEEKGSVKFNFYDVSKQIYMSPETIKFNTMIGTIIFSAIYLYIVVMTVIDAISYGGIFDVLYTIFVHAVLSAIVLGIVFGTKYYNNQFADFQDIILTREKLEIVLMPEARGKKTDVKTEFLISEIKPRYKHIGKKSRLLLYIDHGGEIHKFRAFISANAAYARIPHVVAFVMLIDKICAEKNRGQ